MPTRRSSSSAFVLIPGPAAPVAVRVAIITSRSPARSSLFAASSSSAWSSPAVEPSP
ncbi:MAG TPA: hypothetical protein VK911_09670 [Vicinamibacterales bacterium]|nr:hypothetical protein [Vicinamibacterales bacterium]